ncbi:hypothetical protein AMECASPLE_009028 [Ameca splendens]|uniref:Uncharacterized protein n=1 Tax=Ameca splendens TaxID=208324 RepID=A0ABV0ZL70_9TELE
MPVMVYNLLTGIVLCEYYNLQSSLCLYVLHSLGTSLEMGLCLNCLLCLWIRRAGIAFLILFTVSPVSPGQGSKRRNTDREPGNNWRTFLLERAEKKGHRPG